MGLFSFFKQDSKKDTAKLAKERLQILIAHEHAENRNRGPSYLPKLQAEILAVIRKYVQVDDESVNVKVEKGDDYDMLELNVTLPESNS